MTSSTSSSIRRLDRRSHDQIRQMSCALGPLHAPDGSAKFGFGQSVVLAAVYGPVGIRLSKEQLDRAFIDVEVKALVGGGDPRDRHHERYIQNILTQVIQVSLYPRSCIRVVCQPTSADGPALSTLINAALLAVMDAGLAVNFTASALSIAITDGPSISSSASTTGPMLLLDPTQDEVVTLCKAPASSLHTICIKAPVLNTSTAPQSNSTSSKQDDNDVLAIDAVGVFSPNQHLQCIDVARVACAQITQFFGAAFARKAQSRGESDSSADAATIPTAPAVVSSAT